MKEQISLFASALSLGQTVKLLPALDARKSKEERLRKVISNEIKNSLLMWQGWKVLQEANMRKLFGTRL